MYAWSDLPTLNLPEAVKSVLLEHLLEPFQSAAEAQSCWQEGNTQLVISAVPENPEYTDPLPQGYLISLVILSDAGEGLYYLTPPTEES